MRTKVFGIGLNKTGTTTLAQCLQHFGYRHTSSSLPLTQRAEAGDLEPVFRHAEQFDSFEDWPWPLLFRQLDERFPGSRFILTVRRSPEVWLASLRKHALLTGPTEFRRIAYGHATIEGHEAEHLARYSAHNQAVRAYFADRPGDLLEVCWETGSGWAELASFLGHPVPDVPLPHANRSDRKRRRLFIARAKDLARRVFPNHPGRGGQA